MPGKIAIVAADLVARATTWPDGSPIRRYLPGAGSGTAKYVDEQLGVSLASAPEVQPLCEGRDIDREDDERLASCTAGDPLGLAVLPYEAYKNHEDELVAIAVDGLLPVPEVIDRSDQRAYPLLRTMCTFPRTS